MTTRLLFVDDERETISALSRYFKSSGFHCTGAYSVGEGRRALELNAAAPAAERFHAIVTDLRMPDGDGLDIVRAVRRLLPGVPVLVLTGYASVATSVEAMRLGAVTILEKPIGMEDLEREIRAAIGDSHELAEGIDAAASAGLIGRSPALQQLFDTVVRVAPSEATVLIQGESGTGKELVAKAIHRFSRRTQRAFVAVNCAAIPENLLESELFGHVRGAFTGAVAAREGRFKAADGGTIFLDEIGELPLALQGKLLRVLQEKQVEAVGAQKPESVDFRLVAATNRDLQKMVEEGRFRGDLFYRLNVVPLTLVPLRERAGDVEVLARHFVAKHGRGTTSIHFNSDALAALSRYAWPGNVRELENLIERLLVMKGPGEIGVRDLPAEFAQPQPQAQQPRPAAPQPAQGGAPQPLAAGAPAAEPSGLGAPPPAGQFPQNGVDLYGLLSELEERLIRGALDMSGGNKKEAARLLGLNRTTLLEKLKKKRREEEAAAAAAGAPKKDEDPRDDGG